MFELFVRRPPDKLARNIELHLLRFGAVDAVELFIYVLPSPKNGELWVSDKADFDEITRNVVKQDSGGSRVFYFFKNLLKQLFYFIFF